MSKENSSFIKHVAFIMDGNGRWATSRLHKRVWGHVRGSQIIPDLVEASDTLGVEQVTFFSFSTENWSRPIEEINTLLKLVKKFVIKERSRILKNNIKFKLVGSSKKLPAETRELVKRLEADTVSNSGLKLNVAFDYGARKEIVDSVNKFIEANPGEPIDEEAISSNLYESNHSDIDLLIRTGGEQRISNFLLWQCAYAELFFTDTKWPDFTCREYFEIFNKVSNRERRFGYVSSRDCKTDSDYLSRRNQATLTEQMDLNAPQ